MYIPNWWEIGKHADFLKKQDDIIESLGKLNDNIKEQNNPQLQSTQDRTRPTIDLGNGLVTNIGRTHVYDKNRIDEIDQNTAEIKKSNPQIKILFDIIDTFLSDNTRYNERFSVEFPKLADGTVGGTPEMIYNAFKSIMEKCRTSSRYKILYDNYSQYLKSIDNLFS